MGEVLTLDALEQQLRRADQAAGQARWPSPTATSTCSTSATCATCGPPGPRRTPLVVAINDDDSVARLKGPGRPIVPAAERAELLAALEPVDFVVVFAGDSPAPLLAELQPDVHCKGTDYGSPGAGPRVRDRPRLRRPHRAGRRSQGPRDERPDRQGEGLPEKSEDPPRPHQRPGRRRARPAGAHGAAPPSPRGADRLGGRGGHGAGARRRIPTSTS